MKTRIIIIICSVLATLDSAGQGYISHQFTLDTIVAMQGSHLPQNPGMTKCRLQDNTFYFVEQQGFQNKENGYQAVIHALSIDNYEQAEILLPLPDVGRNKERYARSLWIHDFCFDGDCLLVTTQEELILYKRINGQNYQVVSTYRHRNLSMGYIHRDKIHFFEEDHDKGFKWFQRDLGGDSATLVRELPYEAPHIVQIQPNRYLFHNQQSVFFLSTRFPRLEVYDLDGRAIETVHFDLPPWKAFGDDYILKTLKIPYGIERIYAIKDELYDYSYPKVAMPLRGDLLLLYMQFDTLTGKSALRYAIRTEKGHTCQYLRTDHEDSVYTAARFPFTLFQGGFDKGNACDNDLLVQITYDADVPWTGKTPSEYQNALNQHFENSAPVLSYKIMRYHSPHKEEAAVYAVGGERVSLQELPSEKSVLILHQDLECSGCTKAIYRLLNQTDLDSVHIGQVFPYAIKGFSAFELGSRIKRDLDKPFRLYYDTSMNYGSVTHPNVLQNTDFPCLILVQKGEKPRLLRSSELYTEDFRATELSETFLKAWQSFVSRQ